MNMEYVEYPTQERLTNFMYRVYGWMATALLLTASTAYYVSTVPAWQQTLYTQPGLVIALFIAQLALVIVLSLFLFKMNLATAVMMFMTYALLLGITLSSIFLVYTEASIYTTFLVTAGMFGTMALYGYVTESDLTTIGNISLMALFGLILGLLINMFLRSPGFDFMLSAIGVIVFTLLTAYDTQKIKRMAQQLMADRETMGKIAILGALTLYLDFINLFLYLLRFMGRRREE